MKNRILTHGSELADFNLVDITSDHSIVPDGGESPQLDLSNNGGGWGNPVIFSSWSDIVQIQLHLMLAVFLNGSDLT